MNAEPEAKPDMKDAAAVTAPRDVAPAATAPVPPARSGKSKSRRIGLMLLLPAAMAAIALYVWVSGGRYQTTENANLRLGRISIASEVAGRVVTSRVSENADVAQGDVLFEVDPEPLKIALAQADAAVATARLNVEQMRAALAQAEAQLNAAESAVSFQNDELTRKQTLTLRGVSSSSALEATQFSARSAGDTLRTARAAVNAARAALGNSVTGLIDAHPAVMAALAARDRAAYNLSVATVRAPSNGILYQTTSFNVGQYVSPGVSLFTIVETGEAWVDANFKETELTNIKPGQTADVVFDVDPDQTYHATVEAIGAGTGAEFSLLPAQNATGNWVKVTQRVPVRLKLDGDHASLLKRSGLSATVKVDTGVTRHLGDLVGDLKAHL